MNSNNLLKSVGKIEASY